jgi:NHL repeat
MMAFRKFLVSAVLAGYLALPAFSQSELTFDAATDFLKLPEDIYLGEVAGVGINSKGAIFVYTRTGNTNVSAGGTRVFTRGGSRLFEFNSGGKFVREIGEGVYSFNMAEALKVDAEDNVWVVDRGSNSVVKFSPDGHVALVLGRKPESVAGGGGGPYGIGFNGQPMGVDRPPQPAATTDGRGVPGDNFNRPTDVAFDAEGNIYVADGYGNARVAKFNKDGRYIKSWGKRGSQPGEFDMPKSIAVDAAGNVYVGDGLNQRIQIFDGDGNVKTQIGGIGTPAAICVSPGQHQYLFSSNSNDPRTMDHGEIYKMELNGAVVGKFGRAGKLTKEFGTTNGLDCRNPNQLYVAEIGNWRVQRVKLK